MIRCFCDASYDEVNFTGKIGLIIKNGNKTEKISKMLGKNILSSTHAELLSLCELLIILHQRKNKQINVFIDDRGIVKRIDDHKNLKGTYREIYKPILRDIRYYLSELEASVTWINRKKNKAADKLTK